jgi:hypothetical protein
MSTCLALSWLLLAAPKVLVEWAFDQPGDLRGWRGIIGGLRLDPGDRAGAQIRLAAIRYLPAGP